VVGASLSIRDLPRLLIQAQSVPLRVLFSTPRLILEALGTMRFRTVSEIVPAARP